MAIKIKYRDPKSTDFSPTDIIINVNEGSLFYKSNSNIFKVTGDNINTEDTEFTPGNSIKGTLRITSSLIVKESATIGSENPTHAGAGRPIKIGSGATPGSITEGSISSKGNNGGWANFLKFLGNEDTDHGGFYGFGTANNFNRWGVAPKYNNHNGLHVISDGNNATEVKVGIGTYSPTSTLSLKGEMDISGSIIPDGSGSHNLGSATNPWKDLHVMNNTIHFYDTNGEIGRLSYEKDIGLKITDEADVIEEITSLINGGLF